MKLVFLETQNLGADMNFERFREFGDLILYERTNEAELKERIRDADIIAMNKIPMNHETLTGADRIKLICVTATGVNNIDFSYTNQAGITVTNVKGYSTSTVAQHTFALLFYVMEKLAYYDHYVKSGEYIKSPLFTHMGESFHDLRGMTFGIVGLGAIGRAVADIAKAFGCRIIYYSTSGSNQDRSYERVDWETLLRESDIISVHAPLTERTKGLFNCDAFKAMKSSGIFLNLGRGPIVVEADLADALNRGEIAGAGLDVLGKEPMSQNNPLYTIQDSKKLIITPHIAWASVEARERLVKDLYENIKAFMEGRERNIVRN